MVSTRRKSYQPGSGDPDAPASPATAVSARLRHNSLSIPTAVASPRRGRRASSLTPLEAEESAETAQARGHRTKALLERYRSEAAGALNVVEEEADKTGAKTAEATPAATVEKTSAESNTRDTQPDTLSAKSDARGAEAKAQDVEEASEDASESAEESGSQDAGEDSSEAVMEVDDAGDDDEHVDVEGVEEKTEAQEAAARRVTAAQRVLAAVSEAPAATPAATPAAVSAAVSAARVPIAAEGAAMTRIRPAQKPRGIAKSGRFWKSVRTKASKVLVRDPVSYEERMQKRQQQRVVKDLENQLKNERKEKLQELRKRREYNAKKAKENALKAEVYQVVKNPNKIKRMKKKQLRLLQTRDTTVVGKSVLDE